jgi:uncharacterized protein involved in outer membrane biogenesis
MRLWHHCVLWPFVGILLAGIYLLNVHWPYRYRIMKPMLEDILGSQVNIGHYDRTYFPNPGFMAADITIRRKSAPNLPPLGSASSVMFQGSWLDLLLLRQRIQAIDITGLHIVIPPIGSPANHEDFLPGSSSDFLGPPADIEQLQIHASTLDILRTDSGRYTFPIQLLTIRNLKQGQTIGYSVDMQNPMPTGHILATGSFGPLNPSNLGSTPLSGDFSFSSVNLHDVGDISGMFSSTGHFSGTLAAIEANAASNTPDFAIGGGKPIPVDASIQSTINGLNGDVILHAIEAKTGATTIHVQGGVVGSPKVTDVDLAVTGGRVQDILRPFLNGQAPITGTVWLQSHAHIDPSGKGLQFLQRLRVDGTFNAPAERLTDHSTEQNLSAFSQRAQSDKPSKSDSTPASAAQPNSTKPNSNQPAQASTSSTDALSSLKGPARIRDGVVSTQRITFQIPGAEADLSGSFNLHDSTVRLAGNLRMQSDISHTDTGFKSILLKPLIPFFKKKKAGADIPIAITGGPGKYKVTQNLDHQK